MHWGIQMVDEWWSSGCFCCAKQSMTCWVVDNVCWVCWIAVNDTKGNKSLWHRVQKNSENQLMTQKHWSNFANQWALVICIVLLLHVNFVLAVVRVVSVQSVHLHDTFVVHTSRWDAWMIVIFLKWLKMEMTLTPFWLARFMFYDVTHFGWILRALGGLLSKQLLSGTVCWGANDQSGPKSSSAEAWEMAQTLRECLLVGVPSRCDPVSTIDQQWCVFWPLILTTLTKEMMIMTKMPMTFSANNVAQQKRRRLSKWMQSFMKWNQSWKQIFVHFHGTVPSTICRWVRRVATTTQHPNKPTTMQWPRMLLKLQEKSH